MNNWILLTILYAVLVSFSELFKKKATKINSIYEVLTVFTTLSFLLTFFTTKDALSINYNFLPIIFIKSSIVVVAWILGLKALDGLQLSIYGMVKISRIIFSIILSWIFLKERITITTLIGSSIIIIGLVLVNITTDKNKDKKNSFRLILIFLISCLCSSASAIIDKKVLLYVSSSQLQFWFLLFLTIYYWIILFFKNRKINIKNLKMNYWLPIVSISTVVADRLLFIANENQSSQVIIMSLLKQLSVPTSIILGMIFLKEKDTVKKILYSILIISGVIIIVTF